MSTIEIFEERLDYKNFDGSLLGIESFENFEHPNPIDFWYDKHFYGRVNEQNDIVYISQEMFGSLDGRMVPISDGKGTSVYAVDFVAMAFNDLKRRINTIAATTGRFAYPSLGLESLFNSFKARRGFAHVDNLYDAYVDTYFNIFLKSYLRPTYRDKKITNFNDFLHFFVEFASSVSNQMPFTKSGFIKSNFCSPLISGLVIEVDFKDHNDDDAKGIYIDDTGFEFYHEIAKQYGFYVDKNAPWRLVANISSPQMQRYWIRGTLESTLPEWEEPTIPEGAPENCKPEDMDADEEDPVEKEKHFPQRFLQPTSVGNFFETYYEKSYKHDINLMGDKLVNFYNQYVSLYPNIVIDKDSSCWQKMSHESKVGLSPSSAHRTLSREVIIREPVTEEELSKIKPIDMFNIYLTMRMKEEAAEMPKAEFDETIRNALRRFKHIDNKSLDNGAAMSYINNAIKGFLTKPGIVLPFALSGEEGKLVPTSAEGSSY